jgi:predicted nuclease of predicted toxin-antitoxin system
LGFGAILAATRADAPSVIQVRAQDITPGHLEATVIAALRQYDELLTQGALITIDETRLRSRVLPLRR